MFLFSLVFAMSLCASVYMCFVVTCWERADLLALVILMICQDVYITMKVSNYQYLQIYSNMLRLVILAQ